ncbi:nucleotidyltransferase substrate binding protein [bacterium]|nr:nucleotidyltransferase substrate binding protein [bacterium]
MSDRKLLNSLDNLERAVARLEEAVALPRDHALIFEATIQCFEYSCELLWKTLKHALTRFGIEAYSPRSVIKEAYKQNLLSDDKTWLRILDIRNTTSHVYLTEDPVVEIYESIVQLTPVFQKEIKSLKSRLEK